MTASGLPATKAPIGGVLPVLSTPFLSDGRCDAPGLVRLVNYVAKAGAHGAVYPAIASEFATLTPDEREMMVDTALSAAGACRLPLVVGISADTPETSQRLGRQAAAGGAAAAMLMAPRSAGQDAAAVSRFFAATATAVGDLPIILQNAPPPLGSCLPSSTVLDVVRAVAAIRYVKEENIPCGQRITALIEGAPDHLLGVMGGAGGRFLLDEYARGACGSMPACEVVEVHVAIWDAVRRGDHKTARMVFNRVLPLLTLGGVFRQAVVKHVLLRRGLIDCERYRDDNPPLDAFDHVEVAAILDGLADLLPAGPATASPGSRPHE